MSNLQDEIRLVESNLLQLKKLSKNAPENYQNKCCLIQSEIAALFNNGQVVVNYKKSIELSKKHCFLHEKLISAKRVVLHLLKSNLLCKPTSY